MRFILCSLLLFFSLSLKAAKQDNSLCPIDCLKFKDNSEKLKKCYDECKSTPLTVASDEKIEKVFKKDFCITECEKNRKEAKNEAPISCTQMCENNGAFKGGNKESQPKIAVPIVGNLGNCTKSDDDSKITCPFGEYTKNGSVEKKSLPEVKKTVNEPRQSYFIITILLFAIIIISIAYIRK